MTDDVTADAVVEGGCSGPNRRTTLRFAWSRTDPLAVRLVLTAHPDHPALPRGQWSVLRDFLRYGLDERTGDGDVRIVPDAATQRVRIELAGDGRCTGVSVSRAVLAEFLDATEAIVPSGEERTEEMLDQLVARLLGA